MSVPVLVAAAMLADLLTFAAVIEVVGIGAELNPVMASGYSLGGIAIVAALKLAALAAIVLLVARVRRPRLRVLAAGIAIVVGVTGAASNVTAWAASAPRAALESIPAVSRPVGQVTLDDPAQLGQPDDHPGAQPAGPVPGRITPSTSAVTASGPEPTGNPGAARPLRGYATWYSSPSGAAAGPALRDALGPGWRGRSVVVASSGASVVVRLTDWCACGARNGVPTLLDLPRDDFAALALPSAGIVRVTVAPIPAPPVTSTKETP